MSQTIDSVQWLEPQYASYGVTDLDHVTVLTGIYADCISWEYSQRGQQSWKYSGTQHQVIQQTARLDLLNTFYWFGQGQTTRMGSMQDDFVVLHVWRKPNSSANMSLGMAGNITDVENW